MILITQDCLKLSRMLIVLGAVGNLFFIAHNVKKIKAISPRTSQHTIALIFML